MESEAVTDNMDAIYWVAYAVFGAMFVSGATVYWRVTNALRGGGPTGVNGGR